MINSVLLLSPNETVVLELSYLVLQFRTFLLKVAIEALFDVRLGSCRLLDWGHRVFHLVYHYTSTL
jgi:hypothetical protein